MRRVGSDSAQGSGLFPSQTYKSKRNPIPPLRQLILTLIDFTSPEERQTFQAIIYVLHEIIITPDDDRLCLEMVGELLEESETGNLHFARNLIFFMSSWVSYGRISLNLLIDMKLLLIKRKNTDAYNELVEQIDRAISYASPVIGRWTPTTTPKADMLGWMNKAWSASDIGHALTEMCLPFYRLQPWEFKDEAKFGPHLTTLNTRCTALTHFVATSILSAATHSEKLARQATIKWLDIAEFLYTIKNFHMMFAIHTGLHVNAVDRLKWLFADLPSKSKKVMETLDSLFSVEHRMEKLKREIEQLAGKVSMIPCIFWLHNKALLSKEASLFNPEDGSIYIQRIVSAHNIFGKMITMQDRPYRDLKSHDMTRWYFMRLEIERLTADEEKLREVSNSVLTKETRSNRVVRQPISWEMIFVNAHNPVAHIPAESQPRKKLSLPGQLSFSSTKATEVAMVPVKKATSVPVNLPSGL